MRGWELREPMEGIMHTQITIQIDGRQAGVVGLDVNGTAEEMEEQIRQGTQRVGRIVLETGLVQQEVKVPAPHCCGHFAESRGHRILTLQSTFGPIKVSRRRFRCAHCGNEMYPTDVEWRCGRHRMTRPLAKRICQLATTNHFPQLPGLIRDQHGVELQHEAILQVVHDVGSVAESQRRLSAEMSVRRAPELGQQIVPEVHPQRICVSCDGIMYCTNRSEEVPGKPNSRRLIWQQMKVGCVAWQDEHEKWHKQLVWGRESPEEFGASLFELACRCGYVQAPEKLFASDGGAWCWDIQSCYFHDASGILDWYHASEHVWAAGREVCKEESTVKGWVDEALKTMRASGGTGLVNWLQAQITQRRGKARNALEELCNYVNQHTDHMHYAKYRDAGWPIGTGMMESSCKQLVGLRLKGPGMHWTESGAIAVTALKAIQLNEKWHEFWKSLILAT